MERQRKLGLIATLLTLSVLVALGALGEWAVRYREAHRETVPGGATPGVFYRHNRTRFAFVRDHDYFRWIRINRLGFRGKETSIEKPDGVFRIMAVGRRPSTEASRPTNWLGPPDWRPISMNSAGIRRSRSSTRGSRATRCSTT